MDIFEKISRFVRGKPLSCEQVNQFIIDYLEGKMDDRTRLMFESHLRQCANCGAFLDQYQSTVHVVRDAGSVDVPQEVVERTLDFLRNHYDSKL